jgi:hypothetical protein
MVDAICRDDVEGVRGLVVRHPHLLHEDARGVKGNWGPPMSYAANLGRNRIIRMLRGLGAEDVQYAFDRACLQGEIDTARLLLDHGADPNARASLRKRLRFVEDETLHEYRDVTPLAWGERFHDQSFVSRPALQLIRERGGRC